MRKLRIAGFTLFEALLTLFLVFLMMGIACGLVTEYSNVVKFSAAKDTSLTSMQVALQEMLDDVRQSTLLESPTSLNSSADLRFQVMDPSAPWLPLPDPFTTSWDPMTAATVLDIHYYPAQGQLLHDAGPVGQVKVTTVVADSVAGMTATSLSGSFNAIQIQLSLREGNRILVITGHSQGPVLLENLAVSAFS